MLEVITYRTSATGIWTYDFCLADSHQRIGSVSTIISPHEPTRIESEKVHWYSQFDLDTTIIPGVGRRINDNVTGQEVFRLIYWRPGLYQLRSGTDSVSVEIRNGQYLFGQQGLPVTALTEHFNDVAGMPRQNMDSEPYFKTTFYEDVSEAYGMMVLSFPALRFY